MTLTEFVKLDAVVAKLCKLADDLDDVGDLDRSQALDGIKDAVDTIDKLLRDDAAREEGDRLV